MSKQEWLIGIVGLLLGVVLTILLSGAYYSTHHNGAGINQMMRMMDGSDEFNSQTCSVTNCTMH